MEENRYGLRNRRRNDREVEEGSDDEDQEPENGQGNNYDNDKEEEEEGRPPQRQRVNEEHVENQDNDWENESLEEPVVLNFDEGGERNQERANRNRGAAADNQGHKGEGLGRGARQGDADAAVNQGRGERGLGRGARRGDENAAAPPPAARPARPARPAPPAPPAPPAVIDTPFRPHVANNLRAYESPINDPTRLAAIRSRGCVISLEQLVNSPAGSVRNPREYMVCIMVAIVSTGSAQTRGRANGGRYAGGSQQTMSYQRMFRCQCIHSDSGRNTFTMFLGEGQGNRMFQASIENRDNGTISKNLCVRV